MNVTDVINIMNCSSQSPLIRLHAPSAFQERPTHSLGVDSFLRFHSKNASSCQITRQVTCQLTRTCQVTCQVWPNEQILLNRTPKTRGKFQPRGLRMSPALTALQNTTVQHPRTIYCQWGGVQAPSSFEPGTAAVAAAIFTLETVHQS